MMYHDVERSAVGRGAQITRHTCPYSACTHQDAFEVGQLILGRIATMYAVINDCISLLKSNIACLRSIFKDGIQPFVSAGLSYLIIGS